MTRAEPWRGGRANDAVREVALERGAARYAEGSCLVAFGATRAIGELHERQRLALARALRQAGVPRGRSTL